MSEKEVHREPRGNPPPAKEWSFTKKRTVSARIGIASFLATAIFWLFAGIFVSIPETSVTIGDVSFSISRTFDPSAVLALSAMLTMLLGKIATDRELIHGLFLSVVVGLVFWTMYGAIFSVYGIPGGYIVALAISTSFGIWLTLKYAQRTCLRTARICGAILGLSFGCVYGLIHGFVFGLVVGTVTGTFGYIVAYPICRTKESLHFVQEKIKALHGYILGEALE